MSTNSVVAEPGGDAFGIFVARGAQEWSRRLGVPVLDEYSSEEATRIALEMPTATITCARTRCTSTCSTRDDGAAGRRASPASRSITNLLNEAMPFIRYVQGDYITVPVNPQPSNINWSQIASIDGRLNDAFINREGRKVPAGSILDATYRWMFDCDLHLAQFEIVQPGSRPGRGARCARRRHPGGTSCTDRSRIWKICLSFCLETVRVKVKSHLLDAFPPKAGKRRPIRREMA